jgi:hypothetical protein
MVSQGEIIRINEIMRLAGFIRFERNDALLDEKLSNPLSPKNLVEGHWFYETVYMPRKVAFGNYVAEAKQQQMTYNQFSSGYVTLVHKYYRDNGWLDFWEMYRDMEARASGKGWNVTPRPLGGHKKMEKAKDGYYMAHLDKSRIRNQRNRRW